MRMTLDDKSQRDTFQALDLLAEALQRQHGSVPSDEMMGYFLMGIALGALAEAGETRADVMRMLARMYPVAASMVSAGGVQTWRAPWRRESSSDI